MKLIFGLMLLKTAACLEFNCSFHQKVPCYAALGHKLNLRMLEGIKYNLKIQKIITSTEKDPVCRVKDNRITENECDLYNNRSVSVINGILIINSVIRADSGNYRLEIKLQNSTNSADLQVIVEGPPVIWIVLGCLAVILVALVIMAYYFYKKKNQIKSTGPESPEPVNEHVAQKNREEEQKKPDIQPKKTKEEEVRYGEVTFTISNVQQPRKMKTQEDCVYSEVHTR